MVLEAAEALAQEGISVEVVDLRTLRPLDTETVFRSVAKTHRVLVVQEGHVVASYGAYISHLVMSEMFDELDAPVSLLSSLEVPMPYSKALEKVILPGKEKVIDKVKALCA